MGGVCQPHFYLFVIMTKKSLDIYDDMPSGMKTYISNYGFHFNKKACEYAVSMMKKEDRASGTIKELKPYSKEQVDDLMQIHGVKLHNKVLYDYVFAANMCKADYLGSSVVDEQHLCLFVKDYLDDVDASEETAFRRWLATMVGNGDPIEWDDLI